MSFVSAFVAFSQFFFIGLLAAVNAEVAQKNSGSIPEGWPTLALRGRLEAFFHRARITSCWPGLSHGKCPRHCPAV